MTVQELIDELSDMEPGAEVRFVYQESYPLQDDIRGVWVSDDRPTCPNCDRHLNAIQGGRYRCFSCSTEYEADEVETDDPDEKRERDVVYIVSAGQNYRHPYGPRAAFEGF